MQHILIEDADLCLFGTEAAKIAFKCLSEIQRLADQAYWEIDRDRLNKLNEVNHA